MGHHAVAIYPSRTRWLIKVGERQNRNLYVPELMAEWTSETDEQYLIGRAAVKIADT
ncbi:MAG: hypothetical protein WCJ47_09240 [Methanomicrobiales archaeon]